MNRIHISGQERSQPKSPRTMVWIVNFAIVEKDGKEICVSEIVDMTDEKHPQASTIHSEDLNPSALQIISPKKWRGNVIRNFFENMTKIIANCALVRLDKNAPKEGDGN